ncbi:hypothetical protein L1049_025731 [Liquidambar formosana]|uniref:Pentatricopeptide repeat-containing protein n=1 Tax=Liquidambar formosana TaxID=63359 RepID=A0AAP0NE70_LIQFO
MAEIQNFKYTLCLSCSLFVNILVAINLYVHGRWEHGWSKSAAAEAEAVAAISCSGHGRAFLDGLVVEGLPVCECNACFRGPDCSEILPGCVADADRWALIKDEAIYQKMLEYMSLSTYGVPRETQLRALKLLKVVLEGNGRNMFEFGYAKMKNRWERLSKTLSSSKPFAWLKCERREDKDCHAVLRAVNVTGRDGSLFGAESHYVRLSLVKSQDDFDLLLHRISMLMSEESAIKVKAPLVLWEKNDTMGGNASMLLDAAYNDKCYSKLSKMEEASIVFDEMISSGTKPNTITFNVLVDGFGKAGNMVLAVAMYEKMLFLGCLPDVVTFTSLIDGYCRAGQVDEGLKLWREMFVRKLSPNKYTFAILINALCKENRLHEACDFLRHLRGWNIVPQPFMYNPVIDGFCKAGNVDTANVIVAEMEEDRCNHDKMTYTILIIGHCMKGRMVEAISIFNKMLVTGCAPDEITVNSLISRLLKAGMPKEAFWIKQITWENLNMDFSSLKRTIPVNVNTDIPVAI